MTSPQAIWSAVAGVSIGLRLRNDGVQIIGFHDVPLLFIVLRDFVSGRSRQAGSWRWGEDQGDRDGGRSEEESFTKIQDDLLAGGGQWR
jgi:hypothetical protein